MFSIVVDMVTPFYTKVRTKSWIRVLDQSASVGGTKAAVGRRIKKDYPSVLMSESKRG